MYTRIIQNTNFVYILYTKIVKIQKQCTNYPKPRQLAN